jgi:hypothetical protein
MGMSGPRARRIVWLAPMVVVLFTVAARTAGVRTSIPLFDALDAEERAKLDAGQAVVRLLPAHDGEVAVFAAIRVSVGSDRLTAWVRAVEQLQRGRYVAAIGRFSNPPRIEDLATLSLPDEDLEALKDCRPGSCTVKLSEAEMRQLRQTATTSGARWKDAVQQDFRRLVLARAQAYVTDGHRSAAPYHDHSSPVSPSAEFGQIAGRTTLQGPNGSRVLGYLQKYPREADGTVESFLYWAREQFSGTKATVTLTHSVIFRDPNGSGDALFVSKQVFATHYFTGSLSVSQIAGGPEGAKYLLYLRRARLDIPEGIFGGLVRRVVHRKLRTEVPVALEELKRRLESGPPRTT